MKTNFIKKIEPAFKGYKSTSIEKASKQLHKMKWI